MRAEPLYENERTRVSRIALGGGRGTAIRKQPCGPDSPRRLRHERSILERLAGVPGVPRLVPGGDDPQAILVEDVGGGSLAARLGGRPVPVGELLGYAIELASIVAAVHRRGVVHKDVNPANILLYGSPPRPMLIDYDLATTFALERPSFTHHTEIVGTLAYLAPEQSGRTGWLVDQRADLYALGATLYELATGAPPFGEGDPLQLTYDHLIRVPVPACDVNPRVPAALSAIIGHLLEKEPDRRYQSAEGLLHDLRRLDGTGAGGLVPGQRDFPWQLTAPSHLVGREREVQVLRDCLTQAISGTGRPLLVAGPPGVGKTVLIDELRQLVTASGGWFVRGKFDQYRQDLGSDGLIHALRGVGRLLLAEPEAALAPVRSALRAALGADAGLVVAVLPEFRSLLDATPETGADDPLRAQARLQQVALQMLRVLARPDRPLVVILDDLQWAGALPIGFLGTVAEEDLRGVLVVGAYRDREVDAAHPLAALLSRWRHLDRPPAHLRLANLPPGDLGALLAEMLRVPMSAAAGLAEAIEARTHGNPFDTVEFVNALRREAVLVPADDGWTWDAEAIRHHTVLSDVVALLAARVEVLPAATHQLLQVMACLGAEVTLDLLRVAAGAPGGGGYQPGCDGTPADVDALLAPALEDGLLVMDGGTAQAVRFRHDRVQQAVYAGSAEPVRRALHLVIARRLALVPEYRAIAAEQYLLAPENLFEPGEPRRVAVLFHEAARHARRLANYLLADRFLAAATNLLERAGTPADAAGTRLRVDIALDRHAALLGLGRFDEADEAYARIERDSADPLLTAAAASLQIAGLTARGRPGDAVELGLATLAGLGHPVPSGQDLMAQIAEGVAALREWTASGSAAEDVNRGVNTDPRTEALAKIINRTIPAAFFSGSPVMAWLMTSAAQMWARGGPSAALMGPMAHAAFVTIIVARDYRTGYAAVRRVLQVGEELGFELETAQARCLYGLSAGPWFDPLEDCIRHARRAREHLVRGGDLVNAAFTLYVSVCSSIECAGTLAECEAEIASGLEFTERTGAQHVYAFVLAYQQVVRALRGETDRPGGADDASFDEGAYLGGLAANPTAAGNYHLMRALAAAIFGDRTELGVRAATAMAMAPAFDATHATVLAHLLQALALVWRAGDGPAGERSGLLAEFGRCRAWMAERAAEAPANFLHLSLLLDAEEAWVTGQVEAAALAFDRAQREVEGRQRPWQRAFIAERRGRFHLAHGLEYAGRAALHEAWRYYGQWGASAKVVRLEREFPFLAAATEPLAEARLTTDTLRSSSISARAIDMLAVLRASQALSSETNLDRLEERVTEVLCALTGATGARLLLRDPDTGGWVLPGGGPGRHATALAEAAQLVPLSAFRYVERTRQPLLVDDATRDDRFARDPYLRGMADCALLVVPILRAGEPTAMLVLENTRSRGAFGSNRLDTVLLIAGQLAVSLDNAVLYAALERKVAERTEALKAANDQLELLAVTDPLTGLANRRRMATVLEEEWRRALRPGIPLAIAMIDIDHFKRYNDEYGHPAGDECLREVARLIDRNVRDTDLVARYGGEEFVIVLPGTDGEAATSVAERVRAAVAAHAQPHERVDHGVVTVSIGVAWTVPVPMSTADQLLKTADGQLYEAKRSGRNCVCTAQ